MQISRTFRSMSEGAEIKKREELGPMNTEFDFMAHTNLTEIRRFARARRLSRVFSAGWRVYDACFVRFARLPLAPSGDELRA